MPATTVKQIAHEVAVLADDDGVAGSYLTNGVDLYRVLGPLEVPGVLEAAEPLIAIEDCRTLDLVLISQAELASWQMRPVVASAS